MQTNDESLPGGPGVSNDAPYDGISRGPFNDEGPPGGWREVPPGLEHVDEALAVVLEQSLAIVAGTEPPGAAAGTVWVRCTDHRDIPEVLHFIGCVSEMDHGDEDALRYYEDLIREMAEDVVAGRSESFAPGGREALLEHLASLPEPIEPPPYVPDWDDVNPQRWLVPLGEEREPLHELLARYEPSVPLIILQGSEMRTGQDLRTHLTYRVKCPGGASADNAALERALADLAWLQPRGLILAIEEASQVLADESYDSFEELIQMLVRLRDSWRGRDDPAAWTVVFVDSMYGLAGLTIKSAAFKDRIWSVS